MRFLCRYYNDIFGPAGQQILNHITAVNIDNAAQYFYEQEPREYWENEHFPSITPPWNMAWFEFSAPQHILSGTSLTEHPLYRISFGMMAQTVPIPEKKRHAIIAIDGLVSFIHSMTGGQVSVGPRTLEEQEKRRHEIDNAIRADKEAHWLTVWSILSPRHGKVVRMVGYAAYLDKLGQAIDGIDMSWAGLDMATMVEDFGLAAVQHLCSSLILPFKYALSLLHCKNVELIDESVPVKIRRRRQRKGQPDLIYKQIAVNPMRKRKRYPANESDGQHRKQRLHICRGHFKDYREGPGLFGKYHDIYWWDQHTRGDAGAGIIAKTYRVEMKA